ILAGGKIDQHLVIRVGRLGIAFLAAQTLGLVKAGFLGNLGRILLVLRDVVKELLRGGVVAAAIQLVRAGQLCGDAAFGRRRFLLETVAAQHKAIGWSRWGWWGREQVPAVPGTAG